MLRDLAERWSRGRIVRRRLPPEHGGHLLWVSPDAALKLWRRDLRQTDPLLLGLAAELVRPGDTVWDVGANIGLFAFAAAVADRPGVVELRIAARGRAGNHLSAVAGSTQTGGHREARKVAAITLDGLLDAFPPPRLLKIDVEGAEALCLRGAERLLAEIRPLLVCEVAAENAAEVGERLGRHGYTLFDAALPADRRIPLATPAWNTLAVPNVSTS